MSGRGPFLFARSHRALRRRARSPPTHRVPVDPRPDMRRPRAPGRPRGGLAAPRWRPAPRRPAAPRRRARSPPSRFLTRLDVSRETFVLERPMFHVIHPGSRSIPAYRSACRAPARSRSGRRGTRGALPCARIGRSGGIGVSVEVKLGHAVLLRRRGRGCGGLSAGSRKRAAWRPGAARGFPVR